MEQTASVKNNLSYNKTFEIAAFVFGGIAILSVTTMFISIFAGSLAVIFAILSKGSNTKMPAKGKVGFLIGIFSIIASFVLIAGTIYLVFFNQEYRNVINKEYEAVYGITFDEYLDIMKAVATGEADEEMLNKIPFYNGYDFNNKTNALEGINPDGTLVVPENDSETTIPDINDVVNSDNLLDL